MRALLSALLLLAVPAAAADSFNEAEAYSFWKAHYTECIAPASGDEAVCERSYEIETELQRRGWCWVAYDQDLMPPGSSRYLNEYLGSATCPRA